MIPSEVTERTTRSLLDPWSQQKKTLAPVDAQSKKSTKRTKRIQQARRATWVLGMSFHGSQYRSLVSTYSSISIGHFVAGLY